MKENEILEKFQEKIKTKEDNKNTTEEIEEGRDYVWQISDSDKDKKEDFVQCRFLNKKWRFKTKFGWKDIKEEAQQKVTNAYFENITKKPKALSEYNLSKETINLIKDEEKSLENYKGIDNNIYTTESNLLNNNPIKYFKRIKPEDEEDGRYISAKKILEELEEKKQTIK